MSVSRKKKISLLRLVLQIFPRVRWPNYTQKSRARTQSHSLTFLKLGRYALLNNPKDLDPSFKTDLDFWECFGRKKLHLKAKGICYNQLLQLCMARTAWSDLDQAVRAMHHCKSWWLALLWSDLVIKLVSVLFGKCTTLVVTKCWPMVIWQPCGDQWKAEKLGAFWRWPITRCLIKNDSS